VNRGQVGFGAFDVVGGVADELVQGCVERVVVAGEPGVEVVLLSANAMSSAGSLSTGKDRGAVGPLGGVTGQNAMLESVLSIVAGISTSTTSPPPSRGRAVALPPEASAMARTMDSPSPAPLVWPVRSAPR
jgi:hypothetical protein